MVHTTLTWEPGRLLLPSENSWNRGIVFMVDVKVKSNDWKPENYKQIIWSNPQLKSQCIEG